MNRFLLKSYWGITPLFMALFLIVSLLFYLNPQWDINITSLFYDAEKKFYLNDKWWSYYLVFKGVHIATGILIAFYIIYLMLSYALKKPNLLNIPRKSIIYLSLVFALGPGLLINAGLKENVGRARPAEVIQFGGEKTFTKAFVISDQNGTSFVSGHASFGYYFISLAFLTSNRKKKLFFTAFSIMLGLTIGMVRVMQGRHFFSDIVLAFFFVYIVAAITYYFMYQRKIKK